MEYENLAFTPQRNLDLKCFNSTLDQNQKMIQYCFNFDTDYVHHKEKLNKSRGRKKRNYCCWSLSVVGQSVVEAGGGEDVGETTEVLRLNVETVEAIGKPRLSLAFLPLSSGESSSL